jgi:hypothetical protein
MFYDFEEISPLCSYCILVVELQFSPFFLPSRLGTQTAFYSGANHPWLTQRTQPSEHLKQSPGSP